jgi:hypothetical protein
MLGAFASRVILLIRLFVLLIQALELDLPVFRPRSHVSARTALRILKWDLIV